MAREDIINEEIMAALRRLGGESLVREMIGIFLDFVPKKMDQVRAGEASSSLLEIEKGAHAIKSSAANVGATRLRQLAEQVEVTARLQSPEPIPGLLEALQCEFDRVCETLRARR